METQTKIILIIDLCILAILSIAQIIRAANNYREHTRFWKQFEAKLKKQDEEFVDRLLSVFQQNPEFIEFIQNIDWIAYKEKYTLDNPGWDKPKLTRRERIKKWIIDIF